MLYVGTNAIAVVTRSLLPFRPYYSQCGIANVVAGADTVVPTFAAAARR